MYTARSQPEILAELQSHSALAESTIEGGFSYDVFASNAVEFQKVELELAEAYANAFGHTATGDYLVLKAAESGIYRRAGNKAIGTVDVTGTGLIRAGSIFATEDNIRFTAISDTEITDSGSVNVEALTIGARFNVGANTVNKMPLNIPGIKDCNNPAAMIDGYDEESDDNLRERYLEKVRYPAASGNPQNYIVWAKSIVGVGAVRVQRCAYGPGTVKVVIVDSNFEAANTALLQRVYNYIESERPIGAQVTVMSAITKPINITAKIVGAVDIDEFTNAVNLYLIQTTKNELAVNEYDRNANYVSLAQIGSLIIRAGADDYNDLRLNGAASNVTLNIEEIAVLGSVKFNE